jgi:hypothetical protein
MTMSDASTDARDQQRLEAALAARPAEELSIRGPFRVLSSADAVGAGTTYEVSATTLVLVDADDPALTGVSIPLPVDATIALDRDGSIVAVSMSPVDPAAVREARAFARSLIDNGAVRGLTPPEAAGPVAGPPVRATHEVTVEADGAKVIRRVGFSIGG